MARCWERFRGGLNSLEGGLHSLMREREENTSMYVCHELMNHFSQEGIHGKEPQASQGVSH